MLDVGGTYPGLYTVAGTYNGKGDYYSEDRLTNIFFEPAGSSSAAAGGGGGAESSSSSSAAATEGDDHDSDSSDSEDDSDDDDNRRRRMLDGEERDAVCSTRESGDTRVSRWCSRRWCGVVSTET